MRIFLLAQDLGEPIDSATGGVYDLPWTWVRVMFYMKRIRQIHERAAIVYPQEPERAVPFRHIMFDDEKLDMWWERFKTSGLG